jgi:hypothetical protein
MSVLHGFTSEASDGTSCSECEPWSWTAAMGTCLSTLVAARLGRQFLGGRIRQWSHLFSLQGFSLAQFASPNNRIIPLVRESANQKNHSDRGVPRDDLLVDSRSEFETIFYPTQSLKGIPVIPLRLSERPRSSICEVFCGF